MLILFCIFFIKPKLLGSVWMSELEGMELNWVQYQISRGIEMRCDSNSIVWMSLHWRLES